MHSSLTRWQASSSTVRFVTRFTTVGFQGYVTDGCLTTDSASPLRPWHDTALALCTTECIQAATIQQDTKAIEIHEAADLP
jgi:hypothetical protein